MSVSFERCVLSCRGLCVGLFTRLIPAHCGVSECDREASIMRRLWLTSGSCPMGGEEFVVQSTYYFFRIYVYFWKTSEICLHPEGKNHGVMSLVFQTASSDTNLS